MTSLTHHVCSVIPPHMLDEIAERGDDGTRDDAQSTIEQMCFLATERGNAFFDLLPASIHPTKRRHVYDARHERRLPGVLARGEGQPESGDPEVNEAFDGTGATWDFLDQVFGRKSIDGHGVALVSTVHYGTKFQNAMWNGHQIVYGDGDGRMFNRFTSSLEIIAHELTHGLTQYATALGYTGQTGALNEHLSDAFGIMVKQYASRETVDDSDWLIGADLLGSDVNGIAVRSMSHPGSAYDDQLLGRDPQPRHMSGYVHTAADNGGVHVNSGILNHAFYLAAKEIGGYSWEVLGRIWYAALMERLTSDADFADFTQATYDIAGERYGFDSAAQRAIENAWEQVGLRVPVAGRRRRAA